MAMPLPDVPLPVELPLHSDATQPSPPPKWFRRWIPCDTLLNPGKCMLLKWVTDGMLESLKEKNPVLEEEPEEEFDILYLCTFEGCERAFAEQSALRKHTNVHGEKQFICQHEGCGKRFMDNSKLKRHFLIHTGERPFVCPVDGCGKAFSLDFNLRSHMRTHSQENYHVCPFEDCRKRYAHEYKLRAHLRICHEKVLPPEMKLTLSALPASLEKEIKIQKITAPASSTSLDRPFACHYPGCDKRYIHEYKLNLHLRREHAEEHPVEASRRRRHAADAEDYMDEGSDREFMKGTSSRGSARKRSRHPKMVAQKTTKKTKPKLNLNIKVGNSHPVRRKEVAREFHAESETEEEAEDTDDEVIGRLMHVTEPYGDEETEEDTE